MSVADTLDIFERGVQDPCSHDLDDEDEDETPLLLVGCPQGHGLRKVQTTPHSFYSYSYDNDNDCEGSGQVSGNDTHDDGLRRIRTVAHSPRRCSRTDSSLFVQQQARRPSCLMRRESSASVIPTHIYGLEKYVSSQLDELSTVPTPTDEDSSHSSVFDSDCVLAHQESGTESSILPVPSHFKSSLPSSGHHRRLSKNESVSPTATPSSVQPTASPQRRASAIKTSLANSFANGCSKQH